jgi:hypothetical protein
LTLMPASTVLGAARSILLEHPINQALGIRLLRRRELR